MPVHHHDREPAERTESGEDHVRRITAAHGSRHRLQARRAQAQRSWTAKEAA